MNVVRLKNPQHSTLLLRRANEMRLSGTLCDTIIEVESHVFQVHSLVLACTSKKLETLLKDKGHRCTLDFLSWKTFQQILDYAYTEALEARVEDLKSLLEAAECLQMEQLGNQCLFLLTSLQKTEPQSKENGSLHREVPQSVQDSFIMNTTASLSSSDNGDQLTDDVTETKKCLMENGESLQTDGHADMSSSPEEKMELQHCQEKQNIQLPSRRPLTIDRQDIEGQRSLTFTDKQTTAARGSVIASTNQHSTPSKNGCDSPWTPLGVTLNGNGHGTVRVNSSFSLSHPTFLSYHRLPKTIPHVFPIFPHPPLRNDMGGYMSYPLQHELFSRSFCSKQNVQEVMMTVKQAPLERRSSMVNNLQEEHVRKHPNFTKMYSCDFCGKEFQDSFYSQMYRPINTGCEGRVCPPCGMRLAPDSEMASHTSTGNKIPLICLLCGKHLESQLEMKEHLMLHTRSSDLNSKDCRRALSGHTDHRRHIRTNSGEHMYECEFCNRCFRDDSSLKNHKRFHTGEKPYECSNCAKKFSLKHQLDTHYRVHTGEKPFECKVCHQRSRDYSAMIKHLRTHNGAAPYQCTICLEYCSSLSAMQKHIKSHKPEDIPLDWSIEKTYLYLCHN
ncbi:zinc finger and BTB domain-containing protein 16-A [Erpetoichthys calabaricus]|uniref:zinc finger and BTB domain-containing protein 16-A n=1 Tax=Erpetoichthys calabaricus TaxID=27687 RepID=UPI0010A016CB|nr:zinc finger and BTB domain-containing protein 16-A [Erpetoichthys calabaricus]